ncbi:MAG: phosphatase PAP2 family protein [Ignavibacteriae bacterium]|nr:phosphatase PAP2 family protein [Ignavibacteriota bacterium]
MSEFLLQIDKSLFNLMNQGMANSFFDATMPFLTDLNKHWIGWILFGSLWLLLLWKGGKKGRIIAIALIPLITFSDQLSSTFIKKAIMRPRPCHDINGIIMMEHLRLLVPCGSGFSFPSSHAVNSFAAATLLAVYYRKFAWAFFTYAVVVSFSRVYVGVHYPYDVFVGGIVGIVCGLIIVSLLQLTGKFLPSLEIKNLPE